MDFGQQYLAVTAVLVVLGGGLWWLRRHGYAAQLIEGLEKRSGRRHPFMTRQRGTGQDRTGKSNCQNREL